MLNAPATAVYRSGLSMVVIGLLAVNCHEAQAYSVLAHEATIDSAWDRGIRPLLLRRFSGASAD